MLESAGEIIGALIIATGSLPTAEVAALPGHEDVGRALISEAMAEYGSLRVWTLGDRWGQLLLELGFRLERTLHRLEVQLPVMGTEIAFTETGFEAEHLDAWLEVNNAAFAGHPEQGGWTETEFLERMKLRWWDPDDLRMAWEGERLVGSCWTKVHADGVGEIYIIGLHPEYHGRGWGKQLVLEGLRHLWESRGCERGMLYVDAASLAAKATYERIGFATASIDRSYVLRV